MSAPFGKPIWANPCGGGDDGPIDSDQPQRSDQDLLQSIILQAENTLYFAEQFREDFVMRNFRSDFSDFHNQWKESRKEWLPVIPKSLGEQLEKHHLTPFEQFELNLFLVEMYKHLQTYAVGLEQVHYDIVRNSETLDEKFQSVQFKLRLVLCEVQNALAERAPELSLTDVNREVMPMEERQLTDATFRHLRDWIIFRDFMICLEYLIEVCQYYKERLN